MPEEHLTPKSGYPYVDRRGMAESVFPVEDSFAFAVMPPASNWAVGWADLMMTMFIFFLVLYVHQSHQGETQRFLGPRKMEVIAGDTAPAQSPATPNFPKITDGAPLVTAGSVRKIEDGGATPKIAPATVLPAAPAATADMAMDENRETLWYRLVHDLIYRQRLHKRAAIGWLEDGSIRLSLNTDWLFAPGQAVLAPDKPELLRQLVEGLRAFSAPVAILAHTDRRPVIAGPFAGNWELSAARAGAFARFLSEEQGVAAGRLTAAGRAESESAAGKSAEALAANRRLEIIVSPMPGHENAR